MSIAGPVVDSGTGRQEGMSQLLAPTRPVTVNRELAENDRKIAKMLWEMLQSGRKWKNACGFDEAPENWDYWNNRQWNKMRAYGLSMNVVNLVYATVETFIGHFADNIPQSIARPRSESQKRTAELATKLLNWSDDINNWTAESELYTRSTAVAGFSVLRNDWDWGGDGNRGAPKQRFVDEATFFASPWTKDPFLSDAQWTMEARNLPKSAVTGTWPDRADEIPAGVWDGSLTPLSGNSPGPNRNRLEAFTTSTGINTLATGVNKSDTKDQVTLIEAWMRQDDGKLRYIACANGIVLEDGPSWYSDEEYPFAVFNSIRSKDSCYGYAIVKWMKSLQDELNIVHSSMQDQLVYESDSPMVVSQANITEGEVVSNAPGSILIDRDPNRQGYNILTKNGVTAASFNLENLVVQRLNELTGNVDILRGEHPANVTTLGAMEILRDEANVLVRKMSAQLLGGVKRKDELTICRLRQYMKDERTVRISGPGGSQELVTVNKKVKLGQDGEWIVANTIPEDFEADIDFSPQPPGGSQARFERAIAMITTQAEDGLPIIDRQWFLESVEEDPEKVAALNDRLAAQAQAQAKAQAAQAGQGGQAGGGETPPEETPMDEQEMTSRVTQLLSGLA